MATGHILPGYGDPVSKLRRIRSAGYPLDRKTLVGIQQSTKVPPEELESIRNNARSLWCYPQLQETSYGQHFAERPADEIMQLRPTSPTRRNKPHPSLVFLTTRLHYIQGYHNPDTSIGKELYQVDSSVPEEQQVQRQAARRKYTSCPDSASLHQYSYKDPHGLKQLLDGRAAQAADAWQKLADDAGNWAFVSDDTDQENVLQFLQREREKESFGQQSLDQLQDFHPRPKTAYPSTQRWMQYAGAQEADVIACIMHKLAPNPDKQAGFRKPSHSVPAQTTISMRRNDISSASKIHYQSKPSRGDFLIHPDWPSTLPHHKVTWR